NRHDNRHIKHRIREDAYTQKHQDIAYIQRVPAMIKNTFGYQFVGINFLVSSSAYNIGQADSNSPDKLSADGNKQTSNNRPEVVVFTKFFRRKQLGRGQEQSEVQENE